MDNQIEIKDMVQEEIVDKLEALRDLEVGSEEHQKGTTDVDKLMKHLVDIEKIELEAMKAKEDIQLRQVSCMVDRKDKKIKNIISVAGIIVPLGVTVWGTLKTLKFETTNTVTSLIGRGFIQKFIPKK